MERADGGLALGTDSRNLGDAGMRTASILPQNSRSWPILSLTIIEAYGKNDAAIGEGARAW